MTTSNNFNDLETAASNYCKEFATDELCYRKIEDGFLAGAEWAEKNPSNVLIERVLTACNAIKWEEKSECAPLADCPYYYMVENLINEIKKRLIYDNDLRINNSIRIDNSCIVQQKETIKNVTSYISDWHDVTNIKKVDVKQNYQFID